MGRADIWVVPVKGGYGVKLELATTPFLSYGSRGAAVGAARRLAKEVRCVVVFLNSEGYIASQESYVGSATP